MASLNAHEDQLTAMEILLEQLFVQNFRNGPAKAADETLANWESTALDILKDNPGSASYAKEFYAEIREALERIRSKAQGGV